MGDHYFMPGDLAVVRSDCRALEVAMREYFELSPVFAPVGAIVIVVHPTPTAYTTMVLYEGMLCRIIDNALEPA